MLTVNGAVAFADRLSAACNVKLQLCVTLGVPLIVALGEPVVRLKPVHRDPEETVHVYGGVPPVAVTVWLYGVPFRPSGSDDVVIVGPVTVIDNDLQAEGLHVVVPASVTCASKV